jgi:hypothetical protein
MILKFDLFENYLYGDLKKELDKYFDSDSNTYAVDAFLDAVNVSDSVIRDRVHDMFNTYDNGQQGIKTIRQKDTSPIISYLASVGATVPSLTSDMDVILKR